MRISIFILNYQSSFWLFFWGVIFLWGLSKTSFVKHCRQKTISVLCFTVSQLPSIEECRVPNQYKYFCSSQLFPHGLPEEFTLIFTLALKKAALRDTIYLFQISDQQGYPQVQLTVCVLIACFALSCLSFLLSLLLAYLIPACALLSLSRSLTFCLSRLLSTHSSRLSSLFCIVIHFPLRFFSLS